MASTTIVGFLKGKNILIVGATGFLGKVFVEKLIRAQPDLECIFILMRARNLQSAQAKLRNEVTSTELFKLLQEHHKGDYERFIVHKVVPVIGDVASEDLGTEKCIRDELLAKVDIIVNMAATTSFNERYDVAMNVNTLGPKNVMEFCRRCQRLQILCHVSTAYVNVGRTGIIKEEILTGEGRTMGRREIDAECDLIERTLKEIRSSNSEQKDRLMKELGLQRSTMFGWPNVYAFTKSMGEAMVDRFREDIPVVVIRPSIIESTLREPFPGWIQGNRMMDAILTAYGKGKLSSFLAHPELILDVVPADIVVNCMVSSIVRHASESGLFVYHVATSLVNPLFYDVVADSSYSFFSSHPCRDGKGNLVKVRKPHFARSTASFKRYMTVRYKIPLQVVGVIDKILHGRLRQRYNRLLRKYRSAIKLAELYEPYLFFEAKFDNSKTETLWRELCAEDRQLFNFDLKSIDWNGYLFNVHLPALIKYVMN